ncbi:MAG TPA: hypothetical protein VGF99_14270 [Myxococcota bacterium]
MRQLTLPRLVVIGCVVGSSACGVGGGLGGIGVGEDFRACAALADIDLEGTDGELPSAEVAIDVDAVDGEGRIVLDAPDVALPLRDVVFGLQGRTLDTLVPPVTVSFGETDCGECGGAYSYVRVVDDVGLWFEGGRNLCRDAYASGGFDIDSAFELGDVVETCAADGDIDDHDDGGTVHDVAVAFDGGVQQLATGDVVDGVIADVEVTVVAGEATTIAWYAEEEAPDGWSQGDHVDVVVEGYVFRRAP